MKLVSWIVLFLAAATTQIVAQSNPTPFTFQTALQNAVDAPPSAAAAAYTSGGPTPSPTVLPAYHDAQGRIVVQGDGRGNYGMRYDAALSDFSEMVDAYGNRSRAVKPTSAMPTEVKHEFIDHSNSWYERFATDSNGGLLMSSADEGESSLATKAAQFGIQIGYPDWLRIDFAKATTINQVDVITLQDYPGQNLVPLRASQPGGPTTFTLQGVTDYEVQYLNGSYAWVAVPGGYVTNTREVAKALTFAPITTTAIRLVTKANINAIPYPDYTRIVEVEAFEQNTHRNVALASQGAHATASSDIPNAPAAAAIDGDETGKNWGNGGGWRDNTPNVKPTPGTVQATDQGGGISQTKYANQFAQVTKTANLNPLPATPPAPGYAFMLERVDLSYTGHTFSAGAYFTNKGVEYWDNAGGSRIEYYDQVSKKLFYVSDWCDGYGTRPVVRINRDAQGRPTDVYLGDDVALLQFVYDSQGWRYTRLIDRATNNTLYGVIRSSASVTHYPDVTRLTTGFMPEYGPIVEWHDTVSPVPNIIATLKGSPYALLPASQSGFVQPARWVIRPFTAERDQILDIQVEYNATDMFVSIPTLNSGAMVLRPDFTTVAFKRASWLGAQSEKGADSRDTLQAALQKQSAGNSVKSQAAAANHSRGRSGSPNSGAVKRRIRGRSLTNASDRAPSAITALDTKGTGSGHGGSGGGEATDTCVVGQGGIAVCGGKPVTYTGSITTTTTGPTIYSSDPLAPNPNANPPPSDPGGGDGPTNPTTGCPEPSLALEKNPSSSTVRTGPNSGTCPPCKPEDPAGAYPPCRSFGQPQSLRDRQITWAKANARRAMNDAKCRAFMLDPGRAKPPPNLPDTPTYFQLAGFNGAPPGVFIWGSQFLDLAWGSFSALDGTGSNFCPDFNPSMSCYCGATGFTPPATLGVIFICPQVWDWFGTRGVEGGALMQLLLMHEFLHIYGLPEQHASDPPGKYPTSSQIDDALQRACAQAVVNAEGPNGPPH